MGIGRKVDHEEIIRLHLAGMSAGDITEELGCCKSTVSKVLNEAGYSMKTGLDKGKILALHRAGWKVKDIAWDVGINEDTVRKVLAVAKEVPRD